MLFIRNTSDNSSCNSALKTNKSKDENLNAFLCETATESEDQQESENKKTFLNSALNTSQIRNEEIPVDNKLDNSLINEIKNYYPEGTLILDATGSKDNYSATLRLKSSSKEEFRLWLHKHQMLSGVVYRLRNIKPRRGKVVLYKCVYRCQHNTYPKRQRVAKKLSKLHTGCEAKMTVTIKAPVLHRRVRSQDSLRKNYPTIVNIDHKHNHSIELEDTLIYNEHSKTWMFTDQSIALPMDEARKEYQKTTTNSQDASDKMYTSLHSPISDKRLAFSESQQNSPEFGFSETPEKQLLTWNESERKLNMIIGILKEGFLENPAEYSKAINKFYSRLINLKSQTEILCALYNFGNSPEESTEFYAKNSSATILQHPNTVVTQFNDQEMQPIGRPSNIMFTEEHGYSKRQSTASDEIMHTLIKAPDSLQECVETIIL